ncbi:MAG: ribbon-helix-helix domain-containing protein [Clostridiales bacterium]|nr:ribbon-helix-helix domain-containing protein [Clostridiales bacterium]
MSDFIPKQYKKDPITIRISFQKLEKIDQSAAAYNMSRSELINQCIDYALANMSTPKKES